MVESQPTGYIDIWPDGAGPTSGRVAIQGWAIDVPRPRAILVAVNGEVVAVARAGLSRPDVTAVFPDLPGAETSGWSAELDLPDGLSCETLVTAHVVRDDGSVAVLAEARLHQVTRTPALPAGMIGFLDVWRDVGPLPLGRAKIRGWVVDDLGPPVAVTVRVGTGAATLARLGLPRPDAAAAHPDVPGAVLSGWELTYDVREGQDDGAAVVAHVIRATGERALLGQSTLRRTARPWPYPEASLGPVSPGVYGGLDMPAGWGLVVRGPFAVQGWVVDTSAPPVAVIVTLAGRGAAIGHLGLSRPVEAERYPELDDVGRSGWVADLDLADAPLGTTEVAAWLGRANGELVQIGRAPIRILGGIEALPPEVQQGGSTPAASDGTISSARDVDERWSPPRVSVRDRGTTSSPGPGLQVGRRVTTEIHVPISPTPGFFLRVHYLAASLRRFSDVFRDLKLVITVGDDVASHDLYALNPWSRHYPLEWRWLDPVRFRAYSYFATAAERFRYEFAGEVVLLMDADTLVVGPLAELVDEAAREPALYGVMSSLSPAWTMARTTFGAFWPALYAGAGLPPPRLICEPYGWGVRNGPQARDPNARQMPPYFNLGFLCGPRTIMRRIGDGIYDGMAAVDRFHQTAFRAQLGLTLTLERHHIPWRTLGLRYNFSNMQPLADAFPADVDDLRVIQYHAGDDFIRDVDIGSVEGVSRLLRRTDLLPINARLRDALAEIHDTVRAERAE